MLTRSRSRFCKTRCSSPARSSPGTTSPTRVGAVVRTRSSSRSTCSRVKSSSAWFGDDLAEVAGDDGRRFEDPAAGQLGHLAAVGVDPDRRLSGDGVDAVAAVGASHQPGRRHGQQPARIGDPLPHDGSRGS